MVEVSIGMNLCESCFLHFFLQRFLITMVFSVKTYTSFLGEFFFQYSLFLEVVGGINTITMQFENKSSYRKAQHNCENIKFKTIAFSQKRAGYEYNNARHFYKTDGSCLAIWDHFWSSLTGLSSVNIEEGWSSFLYSIFRSYKHGSLILYKSFDKKWFVETLPFRLSS